MRLFLAAVIAAALVSLVPIGTPRVSACSFSGPVPTPPESGATLGEDCWHFGDGSALPAFEGMQLTPYYYQREDGRWMPRDATSSSEYWAMIAKVVDEEGVAAAAQAETEDDEDLPLAVIIPAAILLPLAVLFIGSLIKPKGGGH